MIQIKYQIINTYFKTFNFCKWQLSCEQKNYTTENNFVIIYSQILVLSVWFATSNNFFQGCK